MLIETQKLTKILDLLNKYGFSELEKDKGARLVLVTGSDLFENKVAVSCYIDAEKATDVEKQLVTKLKNFEKEFLVVGQDIKDGSKRVGVMLLLPRYENEHGKVVQRGYDLWTFNDGLVKLREWAQREKK